MWQGAAHRLFLRFTTPSTMKLNSNNMHIVNVTRSFTPLRLNTWIYHWILNSYHVWSFIWIEAHQCFWCRWRLHLIYDICTLICTRICTRKCTCVYTHTLACPSVGSYSNKYIFKYSSSHHAYTLNLNFRPITVSYTFANRFLRFHEPAVNFLTRVHMHVGKTNI